MCFDIGFVYYKMHNVILEHLYNVEGHTNNDILAYLNEYFPESNGDNVKYAKENLISLVKNNLIILTTNDYLSMDRYWSFKNMQDNIGGLAGVGIIGRITFEGKNYIDNLRRNIKQDAALLAEAKSVTDTNTSVQTLNTETVTFYKKQRAYNNIQKWLTAAIFVSSAIYTGVTWMMYKHPKQNPTEEPRLEKIEKELDNLKKDYQKTKPLPIIGVTDSLPKPIK